MEIKILRLTCLRCFHKWFPRKPVVVVCPGCHTPYWNKRKEGTVCDLIPYAIEEDAELLDSGSVLAEYEAQHGLKIGAMSDDDELEDDDE